jgi:hypothetical protein
MLVGAVYAGLGCVCEVTAREVSFGELGRGATGRGQTIGVGGSLAGLSATTVLEVVGILAVC